MRNGTAHSGAFTHQAHFPPALVLNADYRPVDVLPLAVKSWQDTIHNVIAGDVDVVKEYDIEVRSPSVTMRLPSVIALRSYVRRKEIPSLNRYNLITLRDRNACAFCGKVFPAGELTFDHVVPRSMAGPHRWENIVSSCGACNSRKGARTPEQAKMPLLWRPWLPSKDALARADFFLQQRRIHEGWKEFLTFVA